MDSFVYIPGVGSIPGVQTELINFNFGVVNPQVHSIGQSSYNFSSTYCEYCAENGKSGTSTTVGYYSDEYIVRSFSTEPIQIMGIDASGKPSIKGKSKLDCGGIVSNSYGDDWFALPNYVRGRFKDNKLIVIAVGTSYSTRLSCGHSYEDGPNSVNLAGSFLVIS